ncbi:hypothetical protein AJ79_06174 [Helicocarpus griseus UAMH5409]|uniref:Xylanolytic transcriptional activator regulatory domain-containing protein n=1 Tax=Helicocarpus griseus UAMH5409 TaxID=1447875 RepID=A0A2B7XF54_9EURO|nr:hypothetical protein AJ79_06174 [Helicocarpus griseus UAMH5409]
MGGGPPASRSVNNASITVEDFVGDRTWAESQTDPETELQDAISGPELDFSLIWPDSEDLYRTLISSDAANQWQIPLGTLPLPSNPHSLNGTTFESPSSFDDRGAPIGAIPCGGSHQAVQDVTKMVASSSSSVTAAVQANSITSVFLDECLHMFFARFIPTFPVMHRATFVFRECTHPLLLSAIAIGSLYIGPKDAVAKGEALWRLAHTAVSTSWQVMITHRGPYDACSGIQLVLTALLSQIYGALSKNRAIRTTSKIFRAHGFHWARHCGMFDIAPYSKDNLPSPDSSDIQKDYQWRTWTAREVQHRALLAHYILDGLVAQITTEATAVRHTANQLGFPSSEATFEASTADDWLVHMRSQSPQQEFQFRGIFKYLFSPTGLPQQLECSFSAFSVKVILEGLQSLLSECDDDDFVAVGTPVKSDVRRVLARVYTDTSRNTLLSTDERLELLLRWHAICLDAATCSSLLCNAVCSRYNITQQVLGGGRGPKSGTLELTKWVRTPDARKALLHAVAIQEIVEQLPRGRAHVIHMPCSLFAAATVYSAFCLAGSTRMNLPRTVTWESVVFSGSDEEAFTGIDGACSHPDDLVGSTGASDTRRYVCGNLLPESIPGVSIVATRNVLYELNSMQKLFRCLYSQWGIAHDMESIVDQWITFSHSS